MWLIGRLAPDFKTIADFRHDNGQGIRNVCRRFVILCRELKLFTHAIVAIDGSKFKAINSRDRNFTPGKIDSRQKQIEQSIQRYLDALETADRTQPPEVEAKTERLQDKIKKLREQMKQLDDTREQLKKEPDGQRSLTDPDARSMLQSGKSTRIVGFLTDALRAHLIANGQRYLEDPDFDPVPSVKLFTPDAGATWLLVAIDPEDPDRAFGLCDMGLGFPELGHVSLAELTALRGHFGLPVERDLFFNADKRLSAYAREAQLAGRIVA